MIEGLGPYTAYVDSGLKTVGVIPAHWRTLRAKTLFREVDERSTSGRETLLSVSHISGVRRRSELNATMFLAKSNVGHKLCQPNDVVINTMWAWMGALGVSPYAGIVSPAYGVYRVRANGPLLPGYVNYLLSAPSYVSEYNVRSSGIHSSRLRLYPEAFLRIPVVVPPAEDQAAIVRFLHHMSRRIDRFIRTKQRLIILLNEQKQTIIHSAVTTGLDPNVPMKDSTVPWLGVIPSHWDTPTNQRIFKEQVRPHNGHPETQLSLSQRDGLVAKSELRERSLQTSSFDSWKLVLPGDLVLNRFKAHLGVFFSATLRGIVSFHYGVFAPRTSINSKYFELLFHTAPYKAIFAGRSNGMTVGLQNLSNQNFYSVRAVVPPIEEQTAIISHLQRATSGQDASIARIKREIALIREYRTRLIADVVTGQLDVRAAAARLPAPAPDEPAPALTDDADLPEDDLEPDAADA